MDRGVKYLGLPAFLFLAFSLAAILGDGAVQDFIGQTIGKTFDFLPYLISVGAWLSAAFLFNRLVNLLFWGFLVRRLAHRKAPRLLVQMSNVVIYGLAIAGIVGVVFEKSLTGLFATSGVIGLILGFALRSIILDLFSGVSINLERPFVIGDFIRVYIRGVPMKFGIVEEVNWRTTKLKTLENTVEIIPNSVLGAATITNLTSTGTISRFQLTIGFDFSVEPERVLRLINAGLRDATLQKKGPLTNPRPKVKTSSYEKGNIQYKIKYFVDTAKCSPGAARAAVLENVFRHVRSAGLKPAYDKSDVYEASVQPMVLDSVARVKETLRQSDIAAVLSAQDIEAITERSTIKSVAPGGTVLEAGEAPVALYILNEGILDVLTTLEVGGEPSRFDSYRTGDLVGNMIGVPTPHQVVACTPASIIEIPGDVLESISNLEPLIVETFDRQARLLGEHLVEQQQQCMKDKKDSERETMMTVVADHIRSFFKSRVNRNFSSAVRSLVGRDPQEQLVNAALASCALVAAADGHLDESEREYTLQTLKSLDLFQDISPEEGLEIFDQFAQDLKDEPEEAKKRLMALVRKSAADPEMAEIILEICHAVSAADGEVDDMESMRIAEIEEAFKKAA